MAKVNKKTLSKNIEVGPQRCAVGLVMNLKHARMISAQEEERFRANDDKKKIKNPPQYTRDFTNSSQDLYFRRLLTWYSQTGIQISSWLLIKINKWSYFLSQQWLEMFQENENAKMQTKSGLKKKKISKHLFPHRRLRTMTRTLQSPLSWTWFGPPRWESTPSSSATTGTWQTQHTHGVQNTEACVRDVCLSGRFTSAVVYQGLIMRLGILGGNVYIDFLISGIVEFPAAILILFTIDRIGRRLPFATANIVSGAACLITAFIPESTWYAAVCNSVWDMFTVWNVNVSVADRSRFKLVCSSVCKCTQSQELTMEYNPFFLVSCLMCKKITLINSFTNRLHGTPNHPKGFASLYNVFSTGLFWFKTAVACVGRLGITMAFEIVVFVNTELYPTFIR